MNSESNKESTLAKMGGAAASAEDKSVSAKSLPSSKHGETAKGVMLFDGWFLQPSERLTRWFMRVFYGEGRSAKGGENGSLSVGDTARSTKLYSGVPLHDKVREHYREAERKYDHTEPEAILYDAWFLPPLRAFAPGSWKHLHWPKRFRLRIKPRSGGEKSMGISQPGEGHQSRKASNEGGTVLTVPVRACSSDISWGTIAVVLALGLLFLLGQALMIRASRQPGFFSYTRVLARHSKWIPAQEKPGCWTTRVSRD